MKKKEMCVRIYDTQKELILQCVEKKKWQGNPDQKITENDKESKHSINQ